MESLMSAIAQLKLLGISALFEIGNIMDAEDPSVDIAAVRTSRNVDNFFLPTNA